MTHQQEDHLILAGREINPWEWGSGTLEFPVYACYDDQGRGIGTFKGMTQKMPELWEAMGDGAHEWHWMTPFYPSGGTDRGYDITKFDGIDPQFGTLKDFDEYVSVAHKHGKKVVLDLALCNTSDQHPWFQASRTNPDGEFGDFYIWSDTGANGSWYRDEQGKIHEVRNILVDDPEPRRVRVQDGWQWRSIATRCWFWDDVRQQFYWSRAKGSQPQLNMRNPKVRARLLDVMRIWAKRGADAFRYDFLPFYFQEDGTPSEDLQAVHDFMREEVRPTMKSEFPKLVLLMESDLTWKKTKRYLQGNELDVGLGFRGRGAIARANARRDATPIVEYLSLLQSDPLPPGVALWNHDENHDDWRDQWEEWAEQEFALQYYSSKGRGYRFVDNAVVGSPSQFFDYDLARRKLFDVIRTFFPGLNQDYYQGIIGTPAYPYLIGSEGDERDRVRTPFQWNSGLNAGFSQAASTQLYLPVHTEGLGSYTLLNLADELKRDGAWVHHRIAVNAMCAREPLLGVGLVAPLLDRRRSEARPIQQFGIARWLDGHDEALIGAFNLKANKGASLSTLLPSALRGFEGAQCCDLFGSDEDEPIWQLNGLRLDMPLPPLGYFAMKIRRTRR